MIASKEKTDYKNYRDALIQRYWRYAEHEFNPSDRYFDQPNQNYHRPPVFVGSKSDRNILTSPDSPSNKKEQLMKLIPDGAHHKWFRSMSSSQALAMSVLGNLYIYDKLSILSRLVDDEGQPLLNSREIHYENFYLEHKINYLGETRKTIIDAFIPGEFQIAIECKFTEFEVGSCSRPRLSKTASNYERDYCNGAYKQQQLRKERCSLTEQGVKYWDYVPLFFKWDKSKDYDSCPLRFNYQLIRNILAAGIKEHHSGSPENGQVLMIYDDRNPANHPGGKVYRSYYETKEALKFPFILKKVSWQNIVQKMRQENVLTWLTERLNHKYGF